MLLIRGMIRFFLRRFKLWLICPLKLAVVKGSVSLCLNLYPDASIKGVFAGVEEMWICVVIDIASVLYP